MRDPFAPRMDLSYPSLRGQTKIHKWSKWITNGRTFHCSGEQISRRKRLYKLRMGLCSTFRNYEVHQNRIFPEIPAKNRSKTGQNRSKTGQKPEPYPVTSLNNFYYWTFLIISKKLFWPILAEPAVLEQI